MSPAMAGEFFTIEPPGKPNVKNTLTQKKKKKKKVDFQDAFNNNSEKMNRNIDNLSESLQKHM